MAYLLKKRDKGWLQRLEAQLTRRTIGKKPKDEEKNLALVLKLYLCLESSTGAAAAVAHAWGVERRTLYNWKEKADALPTMTIARKLQKDAGQTVFTSDSCRAATYTNANIGPLRLFAARAKEGESISHSQAVAEYAAAPVVFKSETTPIVADFKDRAPFLEAELKRVHNQTNGCISWIGLKRADSEWGGWSRCENRLRVHHQTLHHFDPWIQLQDGTDPPLSKQGY
jgi:hypothetical protein